MSSLGLWGRRCGFFGCFGSFRDGAPASCLDWHMGKYCSSRPVEDDTSCCLALRVRARIPLAVLHLCWCSEGQEAPRWRWLIWTKRPSRVSFVLVAGKVLLDRPMVHVLEELYETNMRLADSNLPLELSPY